MSDTKKQEAFSSRPRLQALLADRDSGDLSGLRLLLDQAEYDLVWVTTEAEVLEAFNKKHIDLLLCSTRLLDMDDGRWLEQLISQSLDLSLILLIECEVGQSGIGGKGVSRLMGSHRHIVKPWESVQFLATIEQLNEHEKLRRNNSWLEQKNRMLEKELAELNAALEHAAHDRDEELLEAHRKLKRSFVATIRMFSNLLEWRGGPLAGHSRRVADLTRQTANVMQLSEIEQQNAFIAALIHDIAHITLPDGMLNKSVPNLNPEEQEKYRTHTALGEQLLLAIDDAHAVASLVRSHHERFDGAGYPDGLKGENIPVGARIIAVADAYDDLMIGHLSSASLNSIEARTIISHGRGVQFDPEVVDAFLQILLQAAPFPNPVPIAVACGELKPGMVLAQDFTSEEGLVLLTAGRILTAELIRRLQLRVDFWRKLQIRTMDGVK